MTRIYLDQPLQEGAECVLPDASSAHLVRVLRLSVGQPFTLFNGRGGEFAARIGAIVRARVTAQVGAHQAIERESALAVTLLPAVVRGERMDYLIQKATELGVRRIQPVLCARGSIRLDAKGATRRLEHWRAVVIAACEQCGRNTLPQVNAPLPLGEVLTGAGAQAAATLRLILLPAAAATLPQLLGIQPTGVNVLSGPEGGFDAAEESLARQAGFLPCRLGPRVLRTETAPLAVLAALQVLAGDYC